MFLRDFQFNILNKGTVDLSGSENVLSSSLYSVYNMLLLAAKQSLKSECAKNHGYSLILRKIRYGLKKAFLILYLKANTVILSLMSALR